MALETPSKGRVELAVLPDRVVEITMTDYMGADAGAYIPKLDALVRAQGGKASLLFNVLAISGFHRDFPVAHIGPFRAWVSGELLHKIAVAHTLPAVRFAIASVSLASGTNIRGFSDRRAALEWARSAGD